MKNTTTGVMDKVRDHTVSQKITRLKKTYGRNIVILDYENEMPAQELEVMIRILSNTSYHVSDDNGRIDTVLTEKNDEKIIIDVSSFVAN